MTKRIVLTVFFIVAAASALAFECSVTCPEGFKGGCVKSENGCACSCRKDVGQVKSDILKTLEKEGASPVFLKHADKVLVSEAFTKTTLTDEKTGKQFTITIMQYK